MGLKMKICDLIPDDQQTYSELMLACAQCISMTRQHSGRECTSRPLRVRMSTASFIEMKSKDAVNPKQQKERMQKTILTMRKSTAMRKRKTRHRRKKGED